MWAAGLHPLAGARLQPVCGVSVALHYHHHYHYHSVCCPRYSSAALAVPLAFGWSSCPRSSPPFASVQRAQQGWPAAVVVRAHINIGSLRPCLHDGAFPSSVVSSVVWVRRSCLSRRPVVVQPMCEWLVCLSSCCGGVDSFASPDRCYAVHRVARLGMVRCCIVRAGWRQLDWLDERCQPRRRNSQL